MNRIKKILIITTSLVLLVGSYFLWTMVTFDEHAESYIQRDLNKNIRDHQYHKLRKMSNSAAYEWLRKANHVKFTFSSDNQGSGNLYYYAARINHQYNFFVTFKVKSFIPSRFTLTRITYYPNYHPRWFNSSNKKALRSQPAAKRPQIIFIKQQLI